MDKKELLRRVSVGGSVLLGSVVGMLSLLMYKASDPSFLVSGPAMTQNVCGFFGAYLASGLFILFGKMSFALPLLFAWFGVAVMRQSEARVVKATALLVFFWMALIMCGLMQDPWRYRGTGFLQAGVVGAFAAKNLRVFVGSVGTVLIALFVGGLALYVAFDGLWQKMWIPSKLWTFRKASAPKVHAPLAYVPEVHARTPEHMTPIFVEAVSAPQVEPKPKRRVAGTQWHLPSVAHLRSPEKKDTHVNQELLNNQARTLEQKFADFGIAGEVVAVRPGPVITLFEFKPGPGVKVSRIAALADDLSMALSAQSVRILAPLPGKAVVGIEIPSETREMVYLREFLQHPDFYGTKYQIPVAMGKDISGHTYIADLAKMPHLLCAGQTGSGKSVFMNGLICSLFYRFSPQELRMILIDPKFIEFRAYQDIPHLLLPVVDDPVQAACALQWVVREMERRYRILAKVGAKNLASFQAKVLELGPEKIAALLATEDASLEESFEMDAQGIVVIAPLPAIVVVIDELADLMMTAKKEVEISIARIAQKARAAGIHLVIATQRPSTDVVTGLIKANLPSRVSFQLASYIDSKTILDRSGAERLLGQGDMLFIPPMVSHIVRLHGAYLDEQEIQKITDFLRAQGAPTYRNEILVQTEEEIEEFSDELFEQALDIIRASRTASASYLQRRLKIGYNRAARLMEALEARGYVGPQDGARPREVIMP